MDVPPAAHTVSNAILSTRAISSLHTESRTCVGMSLPFHRLEAALPDHHQGVARHVVGAVRLIKGVVQHHMLFQPISEHNTARPKVSSFQMAMATTLMEHNLKKTPARRSPCGRTEVQAHKQVYWIRALQRASHANQTILHNEHVIRPMHHTKEPLNLTHPSSMP